MSLSFSLSLCFRLHKELQKKKVSRINWLILAGGEDWTKKINFLFYFVLFFRNIGKDFFFAQKSKLKVLCLALGIQGTFDTRRIVPAYNRRTIWFKPRWYNFRRNRILLDLIVRMLLVLRARCASVSVSCWLEFRKLFSNLITDLTLEENMKIGHWQVKGVL